jgi:hypothetical protein
MYPFPQSTFRLQPFRLKCKYVLNGHLVLLNLSSIFCFLKLFLFPLSTYLLLNISAKDSASLDELACSFVANIFGGARAACAAALSVTLSMTREELPPGKAPTGVTSSEVDDGKV